MNKAISLLQPAVVPARRRAARVETPTQAAPPAETAPKERSDRVTISQSARIRQGGASGVLADSAPTGREVRLARAMDGLRSAFFSKAGDDRYNAAYDFNRDGVINTRDLGVLREKFASSAPIQGPQPSQAPDPAPPTLQELRDAFFTRRGEEGYNAAADLDGDGVVNTRDLALFRRSTSTPVAPPDLQATPPQVGATQTDAASNIQPTQPVPNVTVADPATPGPVKTSEAEQIEPVVDEAGATAQAPTRDSVLAQLRAAFFSTRGDDRFDASLDANGDGVINVRDFVAARLAAHGLNEADD